ncbi:MAG: hypothetical protein HYW06_10630 [Gemmatimonadetes bacterium]|nr:hypothetical protein [Gemmatimonadota bacterium]MBI2403464.1 hypothetical protein [Gemmatimonadota bacterium]MBI2537393.1 hypothetical protein [Gemmatimonadota bacterium]
MNHAADTAMFWVGALFVFTPIVFFGIVIGVWWYQQKKRRAEVREEPDASEVSPQSAQRTTQR